jgi:hypothetical protein
MMFSGFSTFKYLSRGLRHLLFKGRSVLVPTLRMFLDAQILKAPSSILRLLFTTFHVCAKTPLVQVPNNVEFAAAMKMLMGYVMP